MIAPYQRPLTDLVVGHLGNEGFDVRDSLALEIPDNLEVGARDPMALVSLVDRLDHADADVVVLSACVQMPSSDDTLLLDAIEAVCGQHGSLFVGANVIRRSFAEAMTVLTERFGAAVPLAAVWSDRADLSLPRASAGSWGGFHFGGVAFKYQQQVPLSDLPGLGVLARTAVDVATTSGPGTGMAADLSRLVALREGAGNHPLALASGVTPQNVAASIGLVDHVLVATGISGPAGGLDEAKLDALLTIVARSR